jgi:Holliday junction resolvasome RuvABC endonuclease subunit
MNSVILDYQQDANLNLDKLNNILNEVKSNKQYGDIKWNNDHKLKEKSQHEKSLIEQIERILTAVKPSLIFIEEYAYSKNMGGQMYLGEFGGIRDLLVMLAQQFHTAFRCLGKVRSNSDADPQP